MTTRYGFLSTYPPTMCGLATFTAHLFAELASSDGRGRVVRVVDTPQHSAGSEVIGELVSGDAASAVQAVSLLNECEIAIVQHEYGVFGGPDGDEVLAVLKGLSIPAVVVLHTVLTAPTTHQREVLEHVSSLAAAVVTLTATARDRLAANYAVDMRKVSVIPHGAPVVRRSQMPTFRNGQPTVLTWGLIGPGKGIEWGIEAMGLLRDLDPSPRYVIAGQTHPKVIAHHGEDYRYSLVAQVDRLGLANSVRLDGHYRHASALADLVASADVVLLPYDSTDQVTSGVLVEAVAAGKPVVATRFPHAVELLGNGAGLLVSQKDPQAIADALRLLFTRSDLYAETAKAASVMGAELMWPAVASRYSDLADRLIRSRVAA